jgi:hypothetical protein
MRREVKLSENVAAPVAIAVEVLDRHPELVFGDATDSPLVFVDRLAVGTGEVSVARKVRVAISDVDRTDRRYRCTLGLRASDHDRGYPTFEGTLEATEASDGCVLELVGSYTPPLGTVGAVGDRLIAHRAALAALKSFLIGVGKRVNSVSSTASVVVTAAAPAVADDAVPDVTAPPMDYPELYVG